MSEYSVGDRVLVPGVVTGYDRDGDVIIETRRYGLSFTSNELRPDTGGRDLTAQDVRDAMGAGFMPTTPDVVADRLTRIARGDDGSAGDDTAPPAAYSNPEFVEATERVVRAARELGNDGPPGTTGLSMALAALAAVPARAAAGPRAGDTTPDDARSYECPDDCEDCQVTVDRLRARVAELETEGAELLAENKHLAVRWQEINARVAVHAGMTDEQRRNLFGDHPFWEPFRELHARISDAGCACTDDEGCRDHELLDRVGSQAEKRLTIGSALFVAAEDALDRLIGGEQARLEQLGRAVQAWRSAVGGEQ